MQPYDPVAAKKFFFSARDRFLYHDVKAEYGEAAGVYRLHVTDGVGSFLPIPRLLELDRNGTVYIGTASKVNERLGNLQKALSVAYDRKQWTASGHGVLDKLRTLPRFVERFPYESLCVTIEPLNVEPDEAGIIDPDHWSLERRLLNEYRYWFGEYPTFNVH